MNREIVIPGGAGIYPLTGDVTSTAGNALVKVTGLQGINVAPGVPKPGAYLEFNQNAGQWQPILRASISVNGITVSDDFDISVNAVHVYVNGTPVA